jgi:WD40 repeat protein
MPRIFDFGVACWFGAPREERSRITLTGEFAGTLAYAAPEQVAGISGPPDSRSDLYSLGVILYQLCVGALPYDVGGSLETVVRNIAAAAPARPARGVLDEDLWIILKKALAKDPERRYQSGTGMGADLRRYLKGEAIEARRDSRLYVARKALSRHRYSAAGIALAIVGLAILGAQLKVNNTRLTEALRISTIERARALGAAGCRPEADALLWPEILPFGKALEEPERSIFDGSPDERRVLWAGVEMQAAAPCLGIATLAENRIGGIRWEKDRVSVISRHGRLHAWSVPEFHSLIDRSVFEDACRDVAVGGHGRSCVARAGAELRYVDLESGRTLGRMDLAQDAILDMRVSESGDALALWKSGDGAEVYSLPSFRRLLSAGPGIPRHAPWLSREGARAAILIPEGKVRVYNLPGGEVAFERQVIPPEWIRSSLYRMFESWSLTSSESGDLLALGRYRHVFIVHGEGSDEPKRLLATVGNVVEAAFSCSGKWLLTGSNQDSRIHLWQTSTWKEWATYPGQTDGPVAMSISPDERLVLSVDNDGVARLWAGPESAWRRELPDSEVAPHDLALEPATHDLWVACSDGAVAKWSLDSAAKSQIFRADPEGTYSVAYSPAIGVVAAGGEHGKTTLFRNGIELQPALEAEPASPVMVLRFSPDGKFLAVGCRKRCGGHL